MLLRRNLANCGLDRRAIITMYVNCIILNLHASRAAGAKAVARARVPDSAALERRSRPRCREGGRGERRPEVAGIRERCPGLLQQLHREAGRHS